MFVHASHLCLLEFVDFMICAYSVGDATYENNIDILHFRMIQGITCGQSWCVCFWSEARQLCPLPVLPPYYVELHSICAILVSGIAYGVGLNHEIWELKQNHSDRDARTHLTTI